MPFGKEKDRLQNVGMSEKEFELAFIVWNKLNEGLG